MSKIIDFDKKLSDYQRKLRDNTDIGFKKAWAVYQDMDPVKRELMIGLLFTIIKSDVSEGLKGEDHSIFFEEIDDLYDKANDTTCYFCNDNIDGNAVGFDNDTDLCLGCYTKVRSLAKHLQANPGMKWR